MIWISQIFGKSFDFRYMAVTKAPVLSDAKDLFISFGLLDCTPLGVINLKWGTTLVFMTL